jgi:hypothetical protein
MTEQEQPRADKESLSANQESLVARIEQQARFGKTEHEHAHRIFANSASGMRAIPSMTENQ